MAGYSKDDYDRLYSIRVVLPDGRRSPVRLHYNRYVMQAMVKARWDFLVPELGITSDDVVVVVGAGYGWGVERLIELTGCTAIGTDISDHIQQSKYLSEEDEIDAAIIAAGFDPLEGHGLEVKNAVFVDNRSTILVLDESMYTQASRDAIQIVLGGKAPTIIITEDLLSDFSDADAELLSYSTGYYGARVCHVLRENTGVNMKTAEEWNELTGQTIVTVGSQRRVG